jgi:hypothetical protein
MRIILFITLLLTFVSSRSQSFYVADCDKITQEINSINNSVYQEGDDIEAHFKAFYASLETWKGVLDEFEKVIESETGNIKELIPFIKYIFEKFQGINSKISLDPCQYVSPSRVISVVEAFFEMFIGLIKTEFNNIGMSDLELKALQEAEIIDLSDLPKISDLDPINLLCKATKEVIEEDWEFSNKMDKLEKIIKNCNDVKLKIINIKPKLLNFHIKNIDHEDFNPILTPALTSDQWKENDRLCKYQNYLSERYRILIFRKIAFRKLLLMRGAILNGLEKDYEALLKIEPPKSLYGISANVATGIKRFGYELEIS